MNISYRLEIFRIVLLFILLAVFAASKDLPKSIIFFIGDGMGLAQITGGKVTQGKLQMERIKKIGLVMTYAKESFVTDSAAAGTALATGYKTKNGRISVSPLNEPFETVLECAESKKMSTGLIATSTISHATPACFAAHVENRKNEVEIARQIAESGTDLLIGGGREYFLPSSETGSKREDDLDPLGDMAKDMEIIVEASDLKKVKPGQKVAALLSLGALPKAADRDYTLAELTKEAIRILSKNSKGFFLMVEGSQIDWAGHGNNQDYMLTELKDFDEAVGVGLDYAEKSGTCLIVVTADHETGGYTLTGGNVLAKEVYTGWGSKGHTGAIVPVMSSGPFEDWFLGFQDNTDIGKKLIKLIKSK